MQNDDVFGLAQPLLAFRWTKELWLVSGDEKPRSFRQVIWLPFTPINLVDSWCHWSIHGFMFGKRDHRWYQLVPIHHWVTTNFNVSVNGLCLSNDDLPWSIGRYDVFTTIIEASEGHPCVLVGRVIFDTAGCGSNTSTSSVNQSCLSRTGCLPTPLKFIFAVDLHIVVGHYWGLIQHYQTYLLGWWLSIFSHPFFGRLILVYICFCIDAWHFPTLKVSEPPKRTIRCLVEWLYNLRGSRDLITKIIKIDDYWWLLLIVYSLLIVDYWMPERISLLIIDWCFLLSVTLFDFDHCEHYYTRVFVRHLLFMFL